MTPSFSSGECPAVLGITGAIGSGKSTCARAFAALGVPVIDADEVARAIHQDPEHPATRALARAFPQAMTADGRLARGSLRTVFARDPDANAELKRILRAPVLAETACWTRASQAPYVVWESALMMDQEIGVDRMLVVDADDAVRIARVGLRNPDWSAAQLAAIISMQLPRAAYLAGADDVVNNEGDEAALRDAVRVLHQTYLQLWSPR